MRDIAAVKLTGSAGEELWRYQAVSSTSSSLGGGGFGISYVLAVAVDGDDNPVLVGSTYNRLVEDVGIPGDWDFFAIKLSGATGDEIWRMQGGAPFVREGLRGAKVSNSTRTMFLLSPVPIYLGREETIFRVLLRVLCTSEKSTM